MTYFADFTPEEHSALRRGRDQGEVAGYAEGLAKGVSAGRDAGYHDGHVDGWNAALQECNPVIEQANQIIADLTEDRRILKEQIALMTGQLSQLREKVELLQRVETRSQTGADDPAVYDQLSGLAKSMVDANEALRGRVSKLETDLAKQNEVSEQLHARCRRNAVFIDAARRTLDALVSTDDDHSRRARALFVTSYAIPLRSMLESGDIDRPLEDDAAFAAEMPRTHALLIKILKGRDSDLQLAARTSPTDTAEVTY